VRLVLTLELRRELAEKQSLKAIKSDATSRQSSLLWHRLLRAPGGAVRVWQIASEGRTLTHGTDRRGRGLMLTVLDYVAAERARVRR